MGRCGIWNKAVVRARPSKQGGSAAPLLGGLGHFFTAREDAMSGSGSSIVALFAREAHLESQAAAAMDDY